MTSDQNTQQGEESAEFRAAADQAPPSFWREFAEFLVHNPSWWLTPLVLVLVLLGLAVVLIPAEALPFIYTLW